MADDDNNEPHSLIYFKSLCNGASGLLMFNAGLKACKLFAQAHNESVVPRSQPNKSPKPNENSANTQKQQTSDAYTSLLFILTFSPVFAFLNLNKCQMLR
eukprot:scaffold235179_cov19-Prasinocladus_malaysianus.AAC.1